MFRFTRLSIGGALAMLVVTAGAARAAEVVANVPFEFRVNDQTLPAGKYVVERDPIDPALLVIREVGSPHSTALAMVRPAAGHDPAGSTPALQFRRDDGAYELRAVWETASEGHVLPTL